MSKVKELKRKQINKAAASYLCDQESGDFYDAYNVLLNVPEVDENDLAANYINVWQPLEMVSVKEMIELIESSVVEPKVPEFIQKIDWKLLSEQKGQLLETIEDLENEQTSSNQHKIDSLNGILNLLDSLEDYAVDEIGVDENTVFNFKSEE
jgi:hypothetical protein